MEWEMSEKKKQPILQLISTREQGARIEETKATEENIGLPWHEELSDNASKKEGFDGDLTQMSFNHVVKSESFAPKQKSVFKSDRMFGVKTNSVSPINNLKF
jgi:hypothetical protein